MSDTETGLTIGDLADRTGVAPATLRMWETRHGFPVPQRLESGHRRYSEADVTAVCAVARLRDDGVRLEHAIARVRDTDAPGSPSIYAVLRRKHPELGVHRLRKSTLLAMSWAMEDEFLAKASRSRVYGAFQRAEFFERAEQRWTEISRTSDTTVFADFGHSDPEASPRRVDLAPDAPLRREWAVVCDSAELPVVLTAWELPGQDATPDRARLFESMWTVKPAAVRDAARVCASVAAAGGIPDAAGAVGTAYAEASGPDLDAVTALFNRVVAYVDRING
jgi:DNA-binding transcriptional MerR regulator